MNLMPDQAASRLANHDHGVLATLHPDRGVDAVPVVYTVADDYVGVPVDTVKPKASTRLQRESNLESDPRATLLIEHWDRDDWSKLWWVRAELRYELAADEALKRLLATQLAGSFSQYRDHPFADVLVLRIDNVSGWSATPA